MTKMTTLRKEMFRMYALNAGFLVTPEFESGFPTLFA
jgi:hypothetical protein